MDPLLYEVGALVIADAFRQYYDENSVKEEFDKADIDKSGFLERKELKKLAQEYINLKMPKKLKTINCVDKLLEDFDINKDGKISIEEFTELFREISAKFLAKSLQEELEKETQGKNIVKLIEDNLIHFDKEDQKMVKEFILYVKK